jgi:hypothetical protein
MLDLGFDIFYNNGLPCKAFYKDLPHGSGSTADASQKVLSFLFFFCCSFWSFLETGSCYVT